MVAPTQRPRVANRRLLALTVLLGALSGTWAGDYYARWDHLDTRRAPVWFDQAKVGVLLYWGVFSVPSFGSEWLWYHWKGRQNSLFSDFMRQHYRPNVSYQEFATHFTCEFYSPERWVELLVRSGALKATNIRLGVYYSLYEWFNPLFLDDREMNFKTNDFVTFKIIPELHDLVRRYEPDLIWADGDWEAPDTYWQSTQFLAWLYTNSSVAETVVANDRWGKGLWCKHGDFRNCKDGHNPSERAPRLFEHPDGPTVVANDRLECIGSLVQARRSGARMATTR
ncbi:hypothetical protein HPB48_013277 [Haemaphysalis longicornis]|uniref:alpha-L-fucosidase n=1 Tax=Haemaphysalis longicornis TaxID=44386 RepID=A0A9J6FRA1_HAELO|nr:hypothetical protein HPB48_013277 [Haemaphysalis longicornis]